MSKNIEALGRLIMERTKKTNRAMQPLGIELGRINSDLSLSPDNSPGPVPKGEYMVCSVYQSIKFGDRVLICWVGYTPVIVDKVHVG